MEVNVYPIPSTSVTCTSGSPPLDNCGNCIFFVTSAKYICPDFGECHRREPGVSLLGTGEWPEVNNRLWCGEYKKVVKSKVGGPDSTWGGGI